MDRLKVIALDRSHFLECEQLRCHPGNLAQGEPRQLRIGGFFDYYEFVSDEHYHWGVTDGSVLLGTVSLAVARSTSHTVVLLSDFFSHPESRQRLPSQKIIERVHEFIGTLSGPVVLLAIENRYRLLDSLIPIAKRFGFVFEAEQILQSVAISCASVGKSVVEGISSGKLSESPASLWQSFAGRLKTKLSWPPVADLLERIVRIDPDARLISVDKDPDSSWAILYSERAYRAYEKQSHMNIIASDEKLISAGAEWATQRGCDWLLLREPFPRLPSESWPGCLRISNRILLGFREADRHIIKPLGMAHLFQGMTL